MVEVLDNPWPKKATCDKCSSVLEYSCKDEKYYEGIYFIQCPVCKN